MKYISILLFFSLFSFSIQSYDFVMKEFPIKCVGEFQNIINSSFGDCFDIGISSSGIYKSFVSENNFIYFPSSSNCLGTAHSFTSPKNVCTTFFPLAFEFSSSLNLIYHFQFSLFFLFFFFFFL
jgi:hypothetical protein